MSEAKPTGRRKRRGAGEGAVFYDKSKGLWVGTVELDSPGGGRRRQTVRAKTKPAMLAKLRAAQAQQDRGLPAGDGTLSVAQWLDWWADNILPGTVTAQTETNYRLWLKNMVVPYVGRIRLAKLGPEHVQAMMRALEDKGLSAGSISLARMVLGRAVGAAERWGKIARNPVRLTDAPRGRGHRIDDALDAGEAAAVLQAARGDRWEAVAVLVLTTGMRQGEALALRWDDVDLTAGTVTVRKAKTDAGVRTIALPPLTVDALRRHRATQRKHRLAAPVWADPGLVFTTSVGTRIARTGILRWWWALTERAGVGRRRFHASRHTAATLMLNNGVPLEVVSKTLGHAGLAITADVYAKVRPELQRTAATAMENVLGGQ